ncbi:hypothetical protein LN996_11650 [Arthrobacter sp. AK01]|uniref:hypothetical protein n=1 Tax=Micrococcaceae TaxID=1268 RepID=UPI001E46F37D|nr:MULTISPECIES: hypothetical protein [Micrococcaceae]MCD4851467.1 hypothetical protein [Arthrobacter sp. AK01]MCP1412029.1 hypothetical protein [Paenarthrobacter sp. A20]
MNSPHGMAMTAAFVLPEAPDFRLLFMAGLVFLAGLAGTGSVLLLLLFAPIISLALMGRGYQRKVAATTPGTRLAAARPQWLRRSDRSRPTAPRQGPDAGLRHR